MAVFQEIRLHWNGREYTLPPNRVMPMLAEMEDVLTLAQLHRYMSTEDLPLAKLSRAFAIALRAAGAHCNDDQVYESMFTNGASEMKTRALGAVLQLQQMMLPPKAVQEALEASASPAPKGKGRRATGVPSKKRSS